MIQCRKSGDKITVVFDSSDPLTQEAISALEKLLKKHGREEELKALAAAKDDPPEIDPGG